MKSFGKFRKKPVVIEAFRYLPDDDNNYVKPWWFHGVGSEPPTKYLNSEGNPRNKNWRHLTIDTWEGQMKALPGDWIILGVRGEQYPCKDDVFMETYEEVEDE